MASSRKTLVIRVGYSVVDSSSQNLMVHNASRQRTRKLVANQMPSRVLQPKGSAFVSRDIKINDSTSAHDDTLDEESSTMLLFNAQHGYIEGLVRGLRVGLLNSQNYVNLTQCETLGKCFLGFASQPTLISHAEDLKLQLTATEYGNFLANVSSPVTTSIISEKATDKLVEEFNYLRAQAVGDLAKFFDYITYSYQIDNVVLLITGTLHERDTHELLERCHPLGWFNSLPALCVATTVEELYNSVLIETPLGI